MASETYTLHVPAAAEPGSPQPLERAVLVRDGFSLGAFLFNALWFFFHRLWLAGLLVLAVTAAAVFLLAALEVRPGATLLAYGLISLLVGLEASSLRRWTLARRGRPVRGVVSARNLADAEAKAFGRWLGGRDTAPPRLEATEFPS